MNVTQLTLQKDEKIAFLGDIHFDNVSPSSRIDDIMETAVCKLEEVRTKCIDAKVKALFLEGDILNRVQVTHQAVNVLAVEFLKFKTSGIELYSVLGNHDIVRNNLENMDKTPIQIMFSLEVVHHINLENRVIVNGKTLITSVDYTEMPPKAFEKAECNILLAHAFYNQSALMGDSKHNYSKDFMKELGYDIAFLGHDHEEYPVAKAGKTLIVRSGSLLRGTAHNYNFTRKPNFIILHDITNITESSLERVELTARDFKEIASSYVLNKKQMSSVTGLQDVFADLAEKLTDTSTSGGDRIYDIIRTDENLTEECRTILLRYITELQ